MLRKWLILIIVDLGVLPAKCAEAFFQIIEV